jgi:DNA-binding transcriptional MocR family regulator
MSGRELELIDLARGELPPAVMVDVAASLDIARLLHDGYGYAPRKGAPQLRSAFVDRLARVATEPAETLVTHGALGAIDLALRAWTGVARRFVCFDPAYREALHIARQHGLPLVALRRSGRVIDWEHVADTLRAGDVVYLVPTANNPDGLTLNTQDRTSLAAAIVSAGAMLIEDDAYGALLDTAEAAPSVVNLVRAARPATRAVRLFSFSKILIPGARICVAEGSLATIDELDTAKADFGTSPLASAVIAAVLTDERLWRSAVDTVRRQLRDGRLAALRGLAHWPLSIAPPDDGYFVWLPLGRVATATFLAAADEAGIRLASGRPFSINRDDPGSVRLSVSWEEPSIVAEACSKLGVIFTALHEGST